MVESVHAWVFAAQRGQERGGVAHRGRRIPVHARQSGTGASVLGADRHVERAQTHVESPAAPRGAGEVVVAVDLHTPVLSAFPTSQRIASYGLAGSGCISIFSPANRPPIGAPPCGNASPRPSRRNAPACTGSVGRGTLRRAWAP